MRKKQNIYLGSLLLLLFQLLQSTAYAQDIKYSPQVEEKINEVENNLGLWVQIEGENNHHTLQERMAHYNVNGISIAVIKDYKVEWARGYGWANQAEQRPVTTTTLFQAGSISKSLNGIGVLKLVQDGKLNLLNDINDYLKSWKFPYDSLSKGKKINTANLLSHSAGLTVHGFQGYEVGTPLPTLPQVLNGTPPANSPAVRSAFEPGAKFQYSGGGTTISQVIVQDVSGKAYDQYMWENVLNPLGMLNSSFTQPTVKEKQSQLATAYYNDGKPVKGDYHLYPEQAAAGLWTNPSDLAKYIIETQLSLKGKSTKVLSQEMTKLRLTPYVSDFCALGVFINKMGKQTYFQHSGGDEGFVAQYYGSMENGNGVVVMTNSLSMDILNEIINGVATVYDWKGFYNPVHKKLATVDKAILDIYVGNYKVDNVIVSVEREGDQLIAVQNGMKMKLNFTSNTEFFIMEVPGFAFSFLKDSNNTVTGIQQQAGGNTFVLAKVG
ncbi:hypothetical protein C3K47_06185 [Solitalea longa]|uniref:Beta-lactamase-related domain-containing protein n=1 Tax=Solitalea longa TaxID=2079460 RepID=A0A2S5A444_9SPHI|nr:serine hydrolase domain-containing protein [Solitalea longa]POY37350.1 hypothetical protein C3K47_06185 [Solitalea longa]